MGTDSMTSREKVTESVHQEGFRRSDGFLRQSLRSKPTSFHLLLEALKV